MAQAGITKVYCQISTTTTQTTTTTFITGTTTASSTSTTSKAPTPAGMNMRYLHTVIKGRDRPGLKVIENNTVDHTIVIAYIAYLYSNWRAFSLLNFDKNFNSGASFACYLA